MTGTIINAAGILAGGVVGFVRPLPERPSRFWFNTVPCVFVIFYGLRLTWLSLNGPWLMILKQLLIMVLAMGLGRMTGHWLRLQKLTNEAGMGALNRMAAAQPGHTDRFNQGFRGSATLFCLSPLGLLGAVQDGLSGYFYPLCVKALVEGLAAWSWAPRAGGSILLAALPVVALQGTITLGCAHGLQPWLSAHGLIDSINAVGGMLVFSVGLVTWGLKKLPLADYLPSLAFAPLLTWALRGG